MRRANNKALLLTMGSAMLISAGAAMAGPPGGIAYDQFTASGGTITSACPTGTPSDCGAPITGNGFFQRSVQVGGATYFQTIVLPTGANVTGPGDIAGLAFADENFVQQGGGTGIADKQSVFAAATTSNPGNFTATTSINAGWAQGAGDVISLSQTLADGTKFNLGFSLTGDGNSATSLTVTQNVALDTAGLGTTEKQKFDLRQVRKTNSGTTAALPAGAIGGPISWDGTVTPEIIQAVWMGQAVGGAGGSIQLSGFQGYTNVSTGQTTSYTDQVTTGPWAFDTASFGGSAPVF